MTTLIVICLRIIAAIGLSAVILVSTQALFWVVRPLFGRRVAEARLLLDPFEVVKDGELLRQKGEFFSRTLGSKMRQIGAVLTTDLPKEGAPAGAVIEGTVPKQVAREAAVSERLDFGDVKAFGIDVAGVLNTVRRYMQTEDRLHGSVTIGANQIEIFAEVTSTRGASTGPWDFAVTGTLSDAADALGYRIVKGALNEATLKGLNDVQFIKFVEALRNYQLYVKNPGQDTMPSLDLADDLFSELERQNVANATVYSYLASIKTIREPRDIDTPIVLMTKALQLDPKNASFSDRLEELRKKRPTVSAQQPSRVVGADLLDQHSLITVHMKEALAAAKRTRSVKIAILANGFDTSVSPLAARQLETHAIENDGLVTDDSFGYGTHLASFVATVAPSAQLLLIKALSNSGGASVSSLAQSVVYAVDQRVDILLITLQFPSNNAAVKDAFDYAVRSGVIVIASAGNTGDAGLVYPAAYPGVIAVGAVGEAGARAPYSSYGPHVKLLAPASSVAPGRGGKMETKEGTTYAAALVAGIAAMLLEAGLEKSHERVATVLFDSGRPVSAREHLVDALTALQLAQRSPHTTGLGKPRP